MEITEVRIKLVDKQGKRLRGFCSITIDDEFVVRDLRVIDGPEGPFVAMPSRRLTAHCGNCNFKNPFGAAYCANCGKRDPCNKAVTDEHGRERIHCEIAHPINAACRRMIHDCVMKAFAEEARRSAEPGYVSSYEDIEQPAPYRKELQQQPSGESDHPRVPHPHHARRIGQPKDSSFGSGVFD